MVRVEFALDSWGAIREDTAAAVEDFPAEELDFRLAPGVMTFREIARHILDAGSGLTGMLLAARRTLGTPDFREPHEAAHAGTRVGRAGPAELARALRESIDAADGGTGCTACRVLFPDHHALRRPEGDTAGDGADDQRTRTDSPRTVVSVSPDEGNCTRHDPPAHGAASRPLKMRHVR